MKFQFIKTLISKIGTFFVTKPLVAVVVSGTTLVGVGATGYVAINKLQDNPKVVVESSDKDTTQKENSLASNDTEKKDEISNEELDKLVNENKTDEEKKDENKTDEVKKEETNKDKTSNTSNNSSSNQDKQDNSKPSTSKPDVSKPVQKPDDTKPTTPSKPNPKPEKPVKPVQPEKPKPTKPSGIDYVLSDKCYAAIASPTTNKDYPAVRSAIDNMVTNMIFNQKASPSAIKNALNNFKFYGYDIVWGSQFTEVILPDGFKPSDFANKISKEVVDNYAYVRVYYDSTIQKYRCYYVAATLDHESILDAEINPK